MGDYEIDEQTREQAEHQVRAFLYVLRTHYGLDEEDLRVLINIPMRLRRRAAMAESLGEWTAKSAITFIVAAFFSGIGWAVIEFIRHVAKT